jgi:hypothetical protein
MLNALASWLMHKSVYIFCCVRVALNLLNWSFESYSFLKKISDNEEEIHEKARKQQRVVVDA